MNHGNLNLETALGLRTLRTRIEAAGVPSSKLDETLNIATWNIREFGRRRRSGAAIHYIAEILNEFDLIAITELRDNLTDLKRVMELLGPYWSVVFSDYNTYAAGNRERIGYLYDKRAAVFTGLAAEADPHKKKDPRTGEYRSTFSWWRSPYMASFRAGNFDFVLLSVHIRWGDSAAARLPALSALAKWIDKRAKEKHVVDKDMIVMGDFNIPKLDDELFNAITSKGLRIPASLRGTAHGSNLMRDKRYDQILHNSRFTDVFTDRGGVLDFFAGDWRALFPRSKYPDMDKRAFTYQVSDHLPLWTQINTWTEDEELDRVINRAQARARR